MSDDNNNNFNITYETLFDITRRERMTDDLQKLDIQFYRKLVGYMNEKIDVMNSAPEGNLFARDEKQITRKQIDNIRKLVSELYSRRERKVMNLAIIKSRTNSKLLDTSALLPEEKMVFNLVYNILSQSKRNSLFNYLQGKQGLPLDLKACINLPPISSKTTPVRKTVNPEKKAPSPKADKSGIKDLMEVKFLSEVPKFVGKELEVYGPYNKDDTASLPKEIADVLVKKGRAVKV